MGYLASLLIAAITVSTVSATTYSPEFYCSSPRTPDHGGYLSSSGYSSSYHAGHVIYYYCDKGYQLYGSYRTVCKYDSRRYSSSWNFPAPVCRRDRDDDNDKTYEATTRPIDCGSLPHPTGGMVSFRRTKLGFFAEYSCNEGYILKGSSFRNCLYSGQWSGEAPVCKPVDCGDLDDPDYGRVDFSSTAFRSKATYRCNTGFTLVGVKTRVCQSNGKWSGDAPVCKRVDCGGLRDPQYGDVDFSSTTFDSKATYSCNKGFTLVGDRTRICQANGQWSGDMPVCKRVDCGDLSNPKYGYVRLTGTGLGSKASYFCNKEFIRVGRKTRVCLSNGKWSGKAPFCKRRNCGKLRHPAYGRVKYRCTTPDCKAYYSCNYGYYLHGDYSRICQYRGRWTGHNPLCIRYRKHY